MKRQVPVNYANRLINIGNVILVTSKYKKKVNIVTLAWQTAISHTPMLLGISVAQKHFSNKLIKRQKEFVINIPAQNLINQTHFCGTITGSKTDKFKEINLNYDHSIMIETPGIKECVSNIECKLENFFEIGDHTLFIGEVLFAKADEELFDFKNFYWKIKKNKNLFHHLGKNKYLISNKIFEV